MVEDKIIRNDGRLLNFATNKMQIRYKIMNHTSDTKPGLIIDIEEDVHEHQNLVLFSELYLIVFQIHL